MRPILRLTGFLCLAFISFSSCQDIQGNGHVITETRTVGTFHSISAKGSMDIYLIPVSSPSGDYQIKLEGESNVLQYIQTHVDGGTLVLDTKSGFNVSTHGDLKAYINVPQLKDVNLYGSGDIIGKDTLFSDDKMGFGLYGSGDVKVAVHAPEIEGNLLGSGKLDLAGYTQDLSVSITGSADFAGESLKAENAKISIMASGDATVYASVKLDANIMGSGDIYYYGNPATVTRSVKGSGEVTKKD